MERKLFFLCIFVSMGVIYDKQFYEGQQDGSYISAQKIIPILYKVIQPRSVLDIGCGVGTWLSVFKNQYNATDILGVDGDYVDRKMLKIADNEFRSHDLKNKFEAGRRFDLAMSVEVGEHLPESSAEGMVNSLTEASDVVLFSAALPGQIGTYHINEQYPEYWAKKFMARGYIPVDLVRKKIWNDSSIEWWYRQNIILYIHKSVYDKYAAVLGDEKEKTDPEFLTRIHPEMLQYFQDKYFQLQSVSGFIRFKLYPLKKWMSKK